MSKVNCTKMELGEMVEKIKAYQIGSIHTIVYRKPISLSKKFGDVVIETESVIQGRFGLDYGDNLSMVAQLHANGMGYGELKGFTPVIDNILYKNDKTGRMAIRFYPFNGGKHSKRCFKNGVEVALEQLLSEGYPKSSLVSSNPNPAPVLALYADNIVSIC